MSNLPEMVSYFNQETRISLMVPQDWTGSAIDSSKFRIFGLPEPGFEEYFDEYRATMSYELDKPDSYGEEWFHQLVAQNNENMSQDYNNYHLVDESYKEVANSMAYIKHYSWTEETTGLTLSQMQSLILPSPYALYIVNAAVIQSLELKYMPIFDAILNSTRIIPKKT